MTTVVRIAGVGSLVVLAACVVIFEEGSVARAAPNEVEARQVESPIKAFFVDGSAAVFPNGARITADSIVGPGTHYSVGLRDTVPVSAVALDSLVGIEAFQGSTNVPASVIGSLGLTALATVGSIALFKAIFGSCPTVYTSDEGGGVLQAEAFSYSIAPLLEGRDLDALDVRPDADGVLRLELRNEALETHYINDLGLVAVDHEAGARVMPDARGLPVGVVDEVRPIAAADREGRDRSTTLRMADDRVLASSDERIRAATADDPYDHVELSFPRPSGDEAVLVLRLRNSLLTTVLFYDMMLDGAGVRALDWIGRDMARIGTVVELGRWFQDVMGLRVEVHDGAGWAPVERVADTGPIAWEEVGVRIPLGDAPVVRVRLRFLVDAWRIDRASLGRPADLLGEHRMDISRAVENGVPAAPEALRRVALPDQDYLATYPGTSVILEFDPPPVREGHQRSYLLASQGYYTEWVRRDWLDGAPPQSAFRPGEQTVEELMALWLERKTQMEQEFHRTKVPVR